MLIQQGDVLIVAVDAIPESAKKKNGAITLAEGESTGHAHRIEDVAGCTAYEDDNGTLWLNVENETTVTHEEHKPVTLPPGTYKISIVREVDPFENEIRSVAD